jgi:hypothetical protein
MKFSYGIFYLISYHICGEDCLGKAETFPYVDANVVSGTSLSLSLFLSSLTSGHKAASLADSSPASVPLPLRVEPKPKSGIRFSLSLHKKCAFQSLHIFIEQKLHAV